MSRSRPARVSSSRAIASAARVESLLRDLADDANAEARAGERLAPHDFVGQAELGADGAHLILEQLAKRLHKFERQIVGKPTDVVVALDVGGTIAATGLNNIRVQGALHEEGFAAGLVAVNNTLLAQNVFLRLLEYTDELTADDLAFLLGVGDARECGEEALFGVDHDEFRAAR